MGYANVFWFHPFLLLRFPLFCFLPSVFLMKQSVKVTDKHPILIELFPANPMYVEGDVELQFA